MAEGRSYADVLFPQMRSPDTWRERLNLDTLEHEHDLPKGLLTSVLKAESAGDPTVKSGKDATGLFQFMPKTAQEYDINPYDPVEAAPAAAKKLSGLYQRYKGDLSATLAAWNWGEGNLEKYGLDKAPTETRGFIRTVTSAMSPREAAAASGRSYAKELFGEAPAQPASPPADAQPVVSSPLGAVQPQTPSDIAITIEKETPDTMQAQLAAMRPLQEFPKDAPVPLPGMTPIPTIRDPEDVAREDRSLMQRLGDVGKVGGAMATGMAGGMAGATLGAPFGLPGMLVGGALGSLGARKFNVATGLEEEGLLGDVASVAAPLLPGIGRAGKWAIGHTRAGRALSKAEEQTAQQATDYATRYQAGEAQRQATTTQRQQRWDALQAERQTQHATRVAQTQQAADEANAKALMAHRMGERDAYAAATQEARNRQADYRQALRDQTRQREQHTAAVGRLEAVPQQYMPATNSQSLYAQLDEVAGSAPVNLAPAKEIASIVREQLGTSMPAMQPSRLQKITADLMEMGEDGSVAQVHQALKDLRPLTWSADGRTRGAAKQLSAGLHRALWASPAAQTQEVAQLMRQARQAYRQEAAVAEMRDVLKRGGPILELNEQGEITIKNVKTLLNRMEKLLQDDYFAGSFSKDDLASLRADVRSFVGTPAMPKQRPPLPGPVPVRETPLPAMVEPRPQAPPLPTSLRPPDVTPRPMTPPMPVEATLPAITDLTLLRNAGVRAAGGAFLGGSWEIGATVAGLDLAEYALSKILLTPQVRPYLLKAIQPGGKIDPKVFGELAADVGIIFAPGSPGVSADEGRILPPKGGPTR